MNALKTLLIIIVLLLLTIGSFFIVYKVTPVQETVIDEVTLPIESDGEDNVNDNATEAPIAADIIDEALDTEESNAKEGVETQTEAEVDTNIEAETETDIEAETQTIPVDTTQE